MALYLENLWNGKIYKFISSIKTGMKIKDLIDYVIDNIRINLHWPNDDVEFGLYSFSIDILKKIFDSVYVDEYDKNVNDNIIRLLHEIELTDFDKFTQQKIHNTLANYEHLCITF